MSAAKKRILIIEDEPDLLKALVVKFIAEKFEVSEAANGEEGLKLALAEHPDMILLDIVMPKMDGITLLKKLRDDNWGKKAKVIILTNLADGEYALNTFDNHTYDYLVKSDWKLEDIVKKVNSKLK